MSKNNLLLGQKGEQLALDFIKRLGYKVLFRNYRSRLGEIDIIARDKGTICFIEVKTRVSGQFGLPAEAVLGRKQKQISRAAVAFLKEKKMLDEKARFDVVSVVCPGNGTPEIKIIQDAFESEQSYVY